MSPAPSSRCLTPPELAARLRVKPSKVLGWIKTGELPALDVGNGRKKPRFRISPEAIAAFEAARTSRPPAPAPAARRRRRTDPGVIQFF